MAPRSRSVSRSRLPRAPRASAPPGSADGWGRPMHERLGRRCARHQYLANSLNSSRGQKRGGGRLLGRDDESVVLLTPMCHLDGHTGTRRAKPLDGMLDTYLVDAGSAVEREDLGGGQPACGVAEHRDLILSVRHDPAIEEGHRLTLAHALAVDRRVADRACDLDAVGPLGDLG